MHRKRGVLGLCVTAIVAAAAWLAGCGKDDPSGPPGSVTVPEAWAGIWQVTLTTRTCATDSLLGVDVVVDTVCAGETAEEFLGLSDADLQVVDCSGGFTDTHLSITCTGSSELFGCTFRVNGSFSADRADSSFVGSGVVNTRLTCGSEVEDDCNEAEFVGRRLAPAPPSCTASKTHAGFASGLAARLERLKTRR